MSFAERAYQLSNLIGHGTLKVQVLGDNRIASFSLAGYDVRAKEILHRCGVDRSALNMHHSDRGCQYASHDYREALRQQGSEASMSRRGDCCDNAVAESFWGTLKNELADEMDFDTRVEARRAIFEYIESFYNLHRRHSSIGYRSPRDHELSFNAGALSA